MKTSQFFFAFLVIVLSASLHTDVFAQQWGVGMYPMRGHCIAPMNVARAHHQLIEWPETTYDIFAIGGVVGDSVVSSCEHYDADGDAWTFTAPLPAPRTDFTAHFLNGKIYVIGGWDGDSTL